jgi:Cu2+-exporting ATPase
MLPFAALGWITPVWAAVGMSISSLTVVLNALRLTRLPSAPVAGTRSETRPLPA